eukprot:TRINITY_DN9141_c0_g1_i4.p1 TRINITY_DN9141_c0_g1~~TRINITY_DN9141_c0_g1_i4.p1  ORF type:complete len:675 (+),score=128.21 TRINITY_DN9141_c0_g1_i4:78-2102(+)
MSLVLHSKTSDIQGDLASAIDIASTSSLPSTNRLPSMQEPVFRQNILARVTRIDEVLAAERTAWREVQGRLVDVERRLSDLEQQACTFTVMNSFRAEAQAHIAEMSDKVSSLALNSCTYQQVESLRCEVDCMRDSFCTVNQFEAFQQQMSDDFVHQQGDITSLRSSIEAVSSWQSSGEAEAMIHAGVRNVVQHLCPPEENSLAHLAPRLEAVEAKCHIVERELEHISNTTRLQTEDAKATRATAQQLEKLVLAHRVEWSAALTDFEVRSEEQLKVHRAEVSADLDDFRRRTQVDGNRHDGDNALREECVAVPEELRKCPKVASKTNIPLYFASVDGLLKAHVSRLRAELEEGMEELRQTAKASETARSSTLNTARELSQERDRDVVSQAVAEVPRLKETVRHLEGGVAFLLTSVGASQEKVRQLSTTITEIDEFVKLAKKEDLLNRPSSAKAILELQRVEDFITKRLSKTEQLAELNDAKLKQQVTVVSSLQQACEFQRLESAQAESQNKEFMDETRRKLQALISKLDLLPGQPPSSPSCISSARSPSASVMRGSYSSGGTSQCYTRVGDHSMSLNDRSASTARGGSASFPAPSNLSLNDRSASTARGGSASFPTPSNLRTNRCLGGHGEPTPVYFPGRASSTSPSAPPRLSLQGTPLVQPHALSSVGRGKLLL